MNFTNYVSNFVGHYDLNSQFIKDVRKVLKGTGFTLCVRGGNPNRKQHEGKMMPDIRGGFYCVSHSGLRAALPLKFATYGRYYLRQRDCRVKTAKSMDFCKGAIMAVVANYRGVGITLIRDVPVKMV